MWPEIIYPSSRACLQQLNRCQIAALSQLPIERPVYLLLQFGKKFGTIRPGSDCAHPTLNKSAVLCPLCTLQSLRERERLSYSQNFNSTHLFSQKWIRFGQFFPFQSAFHIFISRYVCSLGFEPMTFFNAAARLQ